MTGFFQHFVVPPTAQHAGVVPLMFHMLQLIHLPFLGVMVGSSLVSLLFGFGKDKEGARLWAQLPGSNLWVWLVLGLVPSFCLPFLAGQLWYEARIPAVLTLELAFFLTLVGWIGLFLFQRLGHPLLGLVGHGCVGLALLVHAFFLSWLADPGQWFAAAGRPSSVHMWHALWLFAQLGVLALMVTMALGAFFHSKLLPKGSWLICLLGSFVLPILVFFDLFSIPSPALRGGSILLGVTSVLLSAAVAVVAIRALWDEKLRQPAMLVLFSLGGFLVFLFRVNDYGMVANLDHLHHQLALQAEKQSALDVRQADRYQKAVVDLKVGKEVMDSRCSACHGWDKKIVGPPLKVVLKKYQGSPERLAAFLLKPTKVDAAYPAMPELGLTRGELHSVASYLLQEVKNK